MSRPVCLLVGGIGGMSGIYRDAAASLDFDLMHIERGTLPQTPPQVARIVVVASVCSHPLREAAARLAALRSIPITYLRKPSVSALRRALAEEVAHATA